MYSIIPEANGRTLQSYQESIYNFFKIFYSLIIEKALPMGMSYTFSASIGIVGGMAGHIKDTGTNDNNDNLAAAALIMALISALGSLEDCTAFSINILVNGHRGKIKETNDTNQIKKLEKQIAQTLRPGFILTATVATTPITIMLFSDTILVNWFKQDPETAQQVQSFLRPYAITAAAKISRMCFEQFLFSYEKQNIVMTLALISLGIGTFFSYAFCFGLGNIPAYGLTGIAYGFIIEAYLTALFLGLCLALHSNFKDIHFFKEAISKPKQEELTILKDLAKPGLQITATILSQVTIPFIINAFAGWINTQALAAQSFCSWLIFFLIIPELAIGQAVGQETKRQLGQAQQKLKETPTDEITEINETYFKTSYTARAGLLATALTMTILSIPFIAYPRLLSDIISDSDSTDPAIISTAQSAIIITGISIILESLSNTMVQTLRQLNQNTLPTTILTLSLWSGVAVSYTLAFVANMGILGLATGYLTGNLIAAALLLKPWYEKTAPKNLAKIEVNPTTKQSVLKEWCCYNRKRLSQEDTQSLLPLTLTTNSKN